MGTFNFRTEDAVFQFERKSLIDFLEHRKSSYDVQELDTLIDVLSSQHEKAILSIEEHRIGFIVLDLIDASDQGSVVCNNCGKQRYRSNQLEAFTVGPDNATFKAATARKGGFKNLFRRKTRPSGIYGGKGYKCPRGHILIYVQLWRT